MKRTAIIVALALVIAGCSSATTRDIDTETAWFETSIELTPDRLSVQTPDQVDIFLNLDGHPNLARLCIEGLGFLTSTSEFKAWERMPEWDDYCATQAIGQ